MQSVIRFPDKCGITEAKKEIEQLKAENEALKKKVRRISSEWRKRGTR